MDSPSSVSHCYRENCRFFLFAELLTSILLDLSQFNLDAVWANKNVYRSAAYKRGYRPEKLYGNIRLAIDLNF